MIELIELTWDNAFSYGTGNSFNFTNSKLTQLIGRNGHGKSSIALVLEEVLFNKNSKGKKRSDILNRYISDKTYSITLSFNKGNNLFKIETKRGTTSQQVKLLKNGVDISAHTATATYKLIEELIGFDHKTFCQIVYQSSANSLEFLTSPDTARKKFLIELLNLGRYTRIGEEMRILANEVNKELEICEGKADTIKDWISKYAGVDFTPKPIEDEIEIDQQVIYEIESIKSSITNISATNKRISQNNTYKTLQSKIDLVPVPPQPDQKAKPLLETTLSRNTKSIEDAVAYKAKMGRLGDECPTCLQSVERSLIDALLLECDTTIETCKAENLTIKVDIAKMEAEVRNWKSLKQSQDEWEKYHQLIDLELQEELLDEVDLTNKLAGLEAELLTQKRNAATVTKNNQANYAHNSRLSVIMGQLDEMTTDLAKAQETSTALSKSASALNTLTKAFSTTGLVAFKIENLVKGLEDLSNEYLNVLSDGRFQIMFKLSDSDKLNVIISDNGHYINMSDLSAGEVARVNVGVLLGIRKLMLSISNSNINLLFLDETISTLDQDGKEKLIEVLLDEADLNTIIVSHDYTHPLLDKVVVVKEYNISKITGE